MRTSASARPGLVFPHVFDQQSFQRVIVDTRQARFPGRQLALGRAEAHPRPQAG